MNASLAPRIQVFMVFVREAFEAFDPDEVTLRRVR